MEIGEQHALAESEGVEFNIEMDRAIGEVKISTTSGLQEFKVDAFSGQVIKIEGAHLPGRLTNFVTGMNLKDLEAIKTTLTQAVVMTESKAKGKAAWVKVGHQRGGVQFNLLTRVVEGAKKM